jgi:hypothetical protein
MESVHLQSNLGGKPPFSYGVFLWFSQFPMGFPMVFLWGMGCNDQYPAWLCHTKSELENGGFIWFYMVLYGKYPLEMDVLYGFRWEFMGKSWEYPLW